MWFRVLLAGLGLSALTACAIVDPVDNRYDTVSRSLAKARNEAIFLNLIRASHDYPLSFVTIANVTPSLSNTTSLGLPSFLLGPSARAASGPPLTTGFTPGRDAIFGNTTASNSTQVSTNFNVSTQETSAFYEGFLKPIDLQTLNYFIRQGYPREFLFWLFTDSFELTLTEKSNSSVSHTYGYHYNPPDDYGCSRTDPKHRCFVDWVHNAAYSGLTVEEKTAQTASAGGGAGGGGGGGGGKGGGGGAAAAGGGKSSSTAYARFCFNPILAQQAADSVPPELVRAARADLDIPTSQIFASSLVCGGDWDPVADADGKPQPDILPLVFGAGNQIRIVPRSAYGVFEFLGTLMKMQRLRIAPSRFAYIPAGRPYAAKPPTLETVHEDPNLMTVLQNLGGECFVHTWFEDGDYCVPEEANTTKRVFGLLAQLIAIQTAATDLSITPVVRVLQ